MKTGELVTISVPVTARLLAALDAVSADLGASTLKPPSREEALRFALLEFCFVRGYLERQSLDQSPTKVQNKARPTSNRQQHRQWADKKTEKEEKEEE